MAFVRVKKIKGQKYAYLVENQWTSKGSRQKVVKYLGKVHALGETENVGSGTGQFSEVVLQSVKEVLKLQGFVEKEGKWFSEHIAVDFKDLSVRQNHRTAVLQMNDGFLCDHTLKEAVNFQVPEEHDAAARKLAGVIVAAGLRLSPEDFARLFETIKPAEAQKQEEFYY